MTEGQDTSRQGTEFDAKEAGIKGLVLNYYTG